MKKLFFILLALPMLWGCEEEDKGDMIWDFANFSIAIELRDAQTGVNLLDPEVEGNVLNQEITMLYRDEVYPMISREDATRTNLAVFRGLVWGVPLNTTEYCLMVGEFKTGGTVDVPFTIDWGDGTQTLFEVTADVDWTNPDSPKVIRSLTIDGVPHEGNWYVVLTR